MPKHASHRFFVRSPCCSGFGFGEEDARRVRFPSLLLLNKARGVAFVLFASLSLLLILLLRTTKREGEVPEENFPSLPLVVVVVVVVVVLALAGTESCIFFYSSSYSSEDSRLENFRILYINFYLFTRTHTHIHTLLRSERARKGQRRRGHVYGG